MNVGSLFSGIGGLDHGLARAGLRHVFLCERDEWRRVVLAVRFPGVPIYDDVRAVARGGEKRRGADVVTGRGGADATTSTEFRSVRGGDSDAAVGTPAVDLLCGGFPCQDLSVAGNRAGLAGDRSGLFFEFMRVAESLRPRWVLVENVPGLFSSQGGRDFGAVVGTLADIGYGVAWRTLDSRFFGVPQRRRRVFIVGALVESDPRAAAERAGEVLAVGSRCRRHPPAGGEAREDIAGTLGGGAGERGWPQDVERMTFVANTLTDDSKGRAPDTQTYVANTLKGSIGKGGGCHIDPEATYIAGPLAFSENQRAEVLETAYARQLTSGGGKPGQGYPAVREGQTVRRLTPTECERLQALPDGFTKLDDKTPDSRRYAGLGDAVTASVGEWLGRRLTAAHEGEAAATARKAGS